MPKRQAISCRAANIFFFFFFFFEKDKQKLISNREINALASVFTQQAKVQTGHVERKKKKKKKKKNSTCQGRVFHLEDGRIDESTSCKNQHKNPHCKATFGCSWNAMKLDRFG
jgi:hypothetical protein